MHAWLTYKIIVQIKYMLQLFNYSDCAILSHFYKHCAAITITIFILRTYHTFFCLIFVNSPFI